MSRDGIGFRGRFDMLPRGRLLALTAWQSQGLGSQTAVVRE
jgi:hypothetical protein